MSSQTTYNCDCILGYREVNINFYAKEGIISVNKIIECPFCLGKGILNVSQKYRRDIEMNRYCSCENVGMEVIYVPHAMERIDYLTAYANNMGAEIMEAHYKHRRCGRAIMSGF